MALGVSLNLALLLGMYWKQLSNVPVHTKRGPQPTPEATLEFSDIKTLDRLSSPYYMDIEEGKKDQTSAAAAAAAIEDPPAATINVDHHDDGATSLKFQSGSCSLNINETSTTPAASSQAVSLHPEATPLADDQATAMEVASNTCTRSLDGIKQGRISMLGGDEAPSEIAVGCPHIIYVVTDSPVAEQQTRGTASSESSPPATTTAASMELLPTTSSCTPQTTAAKGKGWKWHLLLWKLSVYFVTLAMLAALLAGLDISWSAITAAVALIVLDFQDAAPSLAKVSYSLLVFFSGMFITVDGFNRTGLPSKFWSVVEPHARINHASGTAVLTAVVVLLSNVASNVPTVLLLGPRVAASSMVIPGVSLTRAWLILAWASSVGGNLTLVGSAANLIVSEQARMATKVPYNLSFWRHMKFGLPSTLLTVAAGIPLIRG